MNRSSGGEVKRISMRPHYRAAHARLVRRRGVPCGRLARRMSIHGYRAGELMATARTQRPIDGRLGPERNRRAWATAELACNAWRLEIEILFGRRIVADPEVRMRGRTTELVVAGNLRLTLMVKSRRFGNRSATPDCGDD